jgi:hypothetical protein
MEINILVSTEEIVRGSIINYIYVLVRTDERERWSIINRTYKYNEKILMN